MSARARREITPGQMVRMRVTGETQFVNESAVDLGAEIQGSLSRWAGDRGVRDLPPEAMARAFYAPEAKQDSGIAEVSLRRNLAGGSIGSGARRQNPKPPRPSASCLTSRHVRSHVMQDRAPCQRVCRVRSRSSDSPSIPAREMDRLLQSQRCSAGRIIAAMTAPDSVCRQTCRRRHRPVSRRFWS